MRRQRTLDAEVVFGLDDAFAEVLLPDAIHHDARRQRVVGRAEPARQVEAVGGPAFHVERIEGREDAGLHGIAQIEEIAALLDARWTKLRRLAQDQRRVDLRVECLDLLLQFRDTLRERRQLQHQRLTGYLHLLRASACRRIDQHNLLRLQRQRQKALRGKRDGDASAAPERIRLDLEPCRSVKTNACPFAHRVRLVEIEEGLVIAARAAIDAPARMEIVLDDIIDGIILLRMIGDRLAEFVRHAVGFKGELTEDKVAARGSAGALHGQAGVGERFEPNRGDDAGLWGDTMHGISLGGAPLAARQNGAVVEDVKLGPLLGHHGLGIDDAPAAIGFGLQIGEQLLHFTRRHFSARRRLLS